MPIRRAASRASSRRGSAAPSRDRPAPRERLSNEERREQLARAGRELFLERPYDQVSMDDVAQRAGVSKALVFHYFSTKRDLYVEVVRRAADDLLQATLVPPSEDPLERLTTGLHRYLDFVEQNAPAYTALLTGGVGVDPEIYALVEQVRRTLAERILEGLPAPDPNSPLPPPPVAAIAVKGFIGFVEASSLAWLDQKTPRDSIVALWIQILMSALS